jgi:hypothetical protein
MVIAIAAEEISQRVGAWRFRSLHPIPGAGAEVRKFCEIGAAKTV